MCALLLMNLTQAFSEAHEQVERIEKTRERQQKQAEALEKRTLSRRASQPAMKLTDAVVSTLVAELLRG